MTLQNLMYLTAGVFLAAMSLELSAGNAPATPPHKVLFTEQQLEVSVEIASNRAEREQGLMHRTQLAENQGMLFVYPDQAPRRVWMKNTLLPLDILFLAADGRIVDILENFQPCAKDPCPIYDSQVPAMYILEVNSHFTGNHQVKVGQKLGLP